MPAKVERVVGTIGIAGPSVLGAIYLQLTEPLADEVTARLLGMRAGESAKSADVNDAIGELCNMISGGFKSTLMDHGMQCAISTPAIIRGTSFSVEAPPDALPEKYFFECGGHRMAVEIHLQLQPTDN